MQDINNCRFPVDALSITEYSCPKCRAGALWYGGDAAGEPPFSHKCTGCGYEASLERIYPRLVVRGGFGVFEIPGHLAPTEDFEELSEEELDAQPLKDGISMSDISVRRPNMDDIGHIACCIHDVVEKHFGKIDDARSDTVYEDIWAVLEEGLKPDDYPDSSYN